MMRMQTVQLRPEAVKATYQPGDVVYFRLASSNALMVPRTLRLSGTIDRATENRQFYDGAIGGAALIRSMSISTSTLGVVEDVQEYGFLASLMSRVASSTGGVIGSSTAGSTGLTLAVDRQANGALAGLEEADTNNFSVPIICGFNAANSAIDLSKLGEIRIAFQFVNDIQFVYGEGLSSYDLSDLALEFLSIQDPVTRPTKTQMVVHRHFQLSMNGSTGAYLPMMGQGESLSVFGGFRNLGEPFSYTEPDNSVQITRVLFTVGGSTSAVQYPIDNPDEIRDNLITAISGYTPGSMRPSQSKDAASRGVAGFGASLPGIDTAASSVEVSLDVFQTPGNPQNYELNAYLRTVIVV